MAERTVEDKLREEYFALLPEVRRVIEELETEVRHCLLPLSSTLDRYERLVVTARVKDCESAVDALRRRQEGATFDADRADSYTLTALNDLVGVRVLAFPRSRLVEADNDLHQRFSSWTSDPVSSDDESAEPLAFKYHGYCSVSAIVRGELQIVPMLIVYSGRSNIQPSTSHRRSSKALCGHSKCGSAPAKFDRRSRPLRMSLKD